jgi:hypothetical protein
MTNFFWNDQEDKHRYHLPNIGSLTQKKKFGGLGIPNLRDLTYVCWHPGSRGIMIGRASYGDLLYMTSIQLVLLICSDVVTRTAPPSGKGVMWAAAATKIGYR